MRAAAALLILLVCSARAEDKRKPKPFHPPSLNPTAHADVTAPSNQKTSASTTLDQGQGSGGDNGGSGNFKVPLTPYEWSGKAAVEKTERAPEGGGGQSTVIGIRKCAKGKGAVVMLDGRHSCCPLGTWGSLDEPGCFASQAKCAEDRKPELCAQAKSQEIRKAKGAGDSGCAEGQTYLSRAGKCCPSSYWSEETRLECYPTEARCLAHSAKGACFQLDARVTE